MLSFFNGAASARRASLSAFPLPPVKHLLQSNSTPSEEERKLIREAIVTVESQRDELQDALALKNPNHSQIRHAIIQADKFIQSHKAILSALRMLPTELLSLIFGHCMAPFETLPLSRTHWQSTPSFRLAQVCSRWRSVAIGTPRLWHMLGDVRLNKKTASTKGYSYAKFLETLLQRSQSEDLWIYVFAPFQEYEEGSHPIIELVARHAERYSALTIESSCITINSFASVKHRLPRLRVLCLELWRYPQGEAVNIFSDAPLLTDVSILGIHPHELVLPWSQLKSYREGSGPIRGSVLQVLTLSTGLEKLRVGGLIYNLEGFEQGSTRKALLSDLKSLSIQLAGEQSRDPGAFLELLITPSLRELKIGGYPGTACPYLGALVQRSITPLSAFPLKSLYLRTSSLYVGHLSSLLRLLPRLEVLDIQFPPTMDLFDLVVEVKTTGTNTQLVPQLTTLIIHGSSDDILKNGSTIKAIAMSRCEIDEFANTDSLHSSESNSTMSDNQESPSRMMNFRLVFSDWDAAYEAQAVLNGWVPYEPQPPWVHHLEPTLSQVPFSTPPNVKSPPEVDDANELLFELQREKLHDELPELDGVGAPLKRKFDLGFPTRLDALLNSIENMELKNVTPLCLSKLHFSLLHLSQMRENHILGDNKYHFRVRAEAVLKKWDPVILAGFTDVGITKHGCWVLKGPRSIVYITDIDPFRLSPKEASSIIYGLEDDMHHVDLAWPDFI